MNQKTSFFIIGAAIMVLVGVVFFRLSPTPSDVISTPQVAEDSLYANDFLKVNLPLGWSAKEATQTIYVGNCINKTNCTTSPQIKPNPSAVNITKGSYILYINTQGQQASGVKGGRFAEIAMGTPSVDGVVKNQPSSECGISTLNAYSKAYSRVDLYIGPFDKQMWCNIPSQNTVWYFSYVTTAKGGYFNYYKEGSPIGFVITMAYNSHNVNNLPLKGSPGLNTALAEMTEIVKTLQIKQK